MNMTETEHQSHKKTRRPNVLPSRIVLFLALAAVFTSLNWVISGAAIDVAMHITPGLGDKFRTMMHTTMGWTLAPLTGVVSAARIMYPLTDRRERTRLAVGGFLLAAIIPLACIPGPWWFTTATTVTDGRDLFFLLLFAFAYVFGVVAVVIHLTSLTVPTRVTMPHTSTSE
jgi:predicted membrane channel-forming protein YqfA (hemolysin III family)